MKKKTLSMIFALATASTMVFSAVGCGGGGDDEKIVTAENVLNVKIRSAGYGTTYIEALAEQFNKTFPEYEVNVLAPRTDLASTVTMREIYTSKEGKCVDVYFSSDFTAEHLAAGDYGQVAADLTELVWNQKPISFDGTEEELTVGEKLSRFDSGTWFYEDKVYGLPFAASFGSLAVNKKVLDGYKLELPRTTDEMFEAAEVIMADAMETDVYPFTFSLSGNNYTYSTMGPWMAQALGYEDYREFWDFENRTIDEETGEVTSAYMQHENLADEAEEIASLFKTQGVKDCFEILYQFFDYNMAAYGSSSQDFTNAQRQIMLGTAVFYSVGDWMFNEEYYRFPDYRSDVVAINAPMVSAIGERAFGPGSTYNLSEEKADEVLSAIVKEADEGKLAAEIKTIVDAQFSTEIPGGIALADIEDICERRGYVRLNMGPGIVVNQKSTKKELAAKFIRFCASTDAGKLFQQEAKTSSCYSFGEPIVLKDGESYPWIESINKITSMPYVKQIQTSPAQGSYRSYYGVASFFPTLGDPFVKVITEQGLSKYDPNTLKVVGSDSIYAEAAATLANKMYTDVKANINCKRWAPVFPTK